MLFYLSILSNRASDTTIVISIAKLKSWFRKMFCLALVPLVSVDDQADRLSVELFDDIVTKYPSITKKNAEDYWTYFIRTHFEGTFSKVMWYQIWKNKQQSGDGTRFDQNIFHLKSTYGGCQSSIHLLTLFIYLHIFKFMRLKNKILR